MTESQLQSLRTCLKNINEVLHEDKIPRDEDALENILAEKWTCQETDTFCDFMDNEGLAWDDVLTKFDKVVAKANILFKSVGKPRYCPKNFNETVAEPATKTKTKKEVNTMTTQNTQNTLNIADIVKMKLTEKLMADKDTKEIPLAKVAILQALTTGQPVDFTEVYKAKMMERVMKDLETGKEIPLGKLMMLQNLQNGQPLDLNAMVMMQMATKFLDEDEKETK